MYLYEVKSCRGHSYSNKIIILSISFSCESLKLRGQICILFYHNRGCSGGSGLTKGLAHTTTRLNAADALFILRLQHATHVAASCSGPVGGGGALVQAVLHVDDRAHVLLQVVVVAVTLLAEWALDGVVSR